MLKQNNAVRDLLRVTPWLKRYTGKGNIVILDGPEGKPRLGMQPYLTDVFGKATESGHASNVAQVIHEFAPGAHIYYLDSTRDKDAVFDWVKANKDRLKLKFINVSQAGLRGMETPDFLRYAALGLTLICASGNDDSEEWISYPARYTEPNFIAVGSATRGGNGVAGYSNEGEGLDVVVPSGVYIQREDGYVWPVDGTSFSAPTVTAMLHVYAEYLEDAGLPDMTPSEVEAFVRGAALDILTKGYDVRSGYGLLMMPATVPIIIPKVITVTEKEVTPMPTETKKLFHVLSKPYLDPKEAQSKADALKAKGITTYLVHSLQFGAFGVEQNAENQKDELLEDEEVDTYVAQY